MFTGPVFSDVDPMYRGVAIPLRFSKVAVFLHASSLAATGYIVDQTQQLGRPPRPAPARHQWKTTHQGTQPRGPSCQEGISKS